MSYKLGINQKDMQDALSLINKWASLILQLETNHNIRKMEVSNLDYDFLYTLGQSVYYINLYNALLIKNFSLNDEYKDISRYIRFFNSLTTSKIKHFFFRESPIININSNDTDYDWEIYFSAKQILNNITDKNRINSIKKNVYKYMLNSSLVYSVLYNSNTNKGIFLHFEDNPDLGYTDYDHLRKMILELMQNIKSESDLRLFADQFYQNYFNYYLSKDKVKVNLNDTVSNIYANFYNHFKNNDSFCLEKYTYRLGEIIWKFDGMIQDDDEFKLNGDKIARDNNLISILKDHLQNFLSLIQDKKSYAKPPYLKMYDLELKFIKSAYNEMLWEKKRSEVFLAFDKIKTTSEKFSSFKNSPEKEVNLDLLIKTCRTFGEKGFRIESLISNLQRNDLLGLLGLFVQFINNPVLTDRKTQFVGIYKSGVFLAHITNILLKLDKPVWLFKTKPYVATHPIHSEETNGDNTYNNIIVFDDVLKTGFTFFMYENYLSRNLNRQSLSLSLYTLSSFDYYKTIDSEYKFDKKTLLQLDENLTPTNHKVLNTINKDMSYSFSLPQYEADTIPTLVDEILSNNRFDLSYVLTNSKICLAVCDKFASVILDRFGENFSNFSIYSPSPDGEVLALFTGLILRLNDKNVSFNNDSIPPGFNKICIDLSLITGSTLTISLKNCTGNDLAGIDSFDLILTIAMSKTFHENPKCFSLYEANL